MGIKGGETGRPVVQICNSDTAEVKKVLRRKKSKSQSGSGGALSSCLNLVSICGPARTGKSLLLTLLAQAPGTFEVSAQLEPATKGAELAAQFWPLESLRPCGSKASGSDTEGDEANGENEPDSKKLTGRGRVESRGGGETQEGGAAGGPSSVEVGFVDTEGLGVKDMDKEGAMLAPVIVLSKVVLFHWPNRPLRDSMLTMLDALVRPAEALCPLSGLSGGEGGMGPPSPSPPSQGSGHLHIVLRNQRHDRGVMDLLTRVEERHEGEGEDEREQRGRRNAMRRRLAARFRSLDVWSLPTPVADVELLESGAFSEADVREEFVDAVDDLRAALLPQLAAPHYVQGKVVTRESLDGLLGELSARGRGEDRGPSEAHWQEVREAEAKATIEFQNHLDSLRHVIEQEAPLLPQSLQGRLAERRDSLVLQLSEALTHTHPQARDATLTSFRRACDEGMQDVTCRNRLAIVDLARVTLDDAKLQYLQLASSLTHPKDMGRLQTGEESAMSGFRARMRDFYAEEPQVLGMQQELSAFLSQRRALATHHPAQTQPPPAGSITSIRPPKPLPPVPPKPCKVVVVGDAGVGKTCLLQRLLTHDWPSPLPIPTVGMDFAFKDMPTEDYGDVRLQMMDTAGQERYHAITASYYRDAMAAIFVFEVTSKASFEHVSCTWIRQAREVCDLSSMHCLILANKADDRARHRREVTDEDIRRLEAETGMRVIETSAWAGTSVEDAFQDVAQNLGRLRAEQTRAATFTRAPPAVTIRLGNDARTGWDHFARGTRRAFQQCCS